MSPSRGPLGGITVLELGHIVAGPTASLILAEFGADVIKIERPGSGDQARLSSAFAVIEISRFQMNARILRASDLIHSDDSQIARSSSRSRHESRNCRERHPSGPPST
jgi:crotonobetainyl-CoA:carnitine CoA-transferase CaiB-like acyl-CoA transferase